MLSFSYDDLLLAVVPTLARSGLTLTPSLQRWRLRVNGTWVTVGVKSGAYDFLVDKIHEAVIEGKIPADHHGWEELLEVSRQYEVMNRLRTFMTDPKLFRPPTDLRPTAF